MCSFRLRRHRTARCRRTGGSSLSAQTKAKAENVPVIPHTSVPNFFKLPPDLYFGEGIGIATNSKGHVFVYTRSGDTRLFEFDQNGTYVREIGQGLYGLGVRARRPRRRAGQHLGGRRGDEHGRSSSTPKGGSRWCSAGGRSRSSAAFDSTLPAAPPEKYQFGRPTDVTWDAQGNIFVSDGYVNSRVVKYDKNGRFLEVGRRRARHRRRAS